VLRRVYSTTIIINHPNNEKTTVCATHVRDGEVENGITDSPR
jgi:hypothetical protein